MLSQAYTEWPRKSENTSMSVELKISNCHYSLLSMTSHDVTRVSETGYCVSVVGGSVDYRSTIRGFNNPLIRSGCLIHNGTYLTLSLTLTITLTLLTLTVTVRVTLTLLTLLTLYQIIEPSDY